MPADAADQKPPTPPAARAELPLAYGPLDPADAKELLQLKQVIQTTLGLEIDSYKEPCLRRRIAVRMRARGMHRYSQYGELLRQDEAERHELLDAVTINVSKFYRNPEVWRLIEEKVIPELFALRTPKIRIWSAGCAGGEEPYTIAMLLHEYAHRHGLQVKLHKFQILATDIDPGILQHAARAEYGEFAFGDIRADARAGYFEQGNQVKPEIRRMVRFDTLDLMNDEYPARQHLIFCRNVIIYFERGIQEKIFRKFHEALVPGGFLVLGKVETLFGSVASLFTPISARERIFCKV